MSMAEKPSGSLEMCMAQKANMEAIFHSVADAIVTVDEELRVTNLNMAARAMLEAPPEWAIGRGVTELVESRLWDLAKLLRDAIRAGGEAGAASERAGDARERERENIVARRDGRELRVLVSASRLVDRDGNTAGAVAILRDITRLRDLERRLETRTAMHGLTGSTHAMQKVYTLIEQAAPTDSTILILGESGTGKELVADAIHQASRRQNGPFVKVNCSALSEGLLESELFGHAKGAFTGALADRKGRFEMADGGTIFLDEIGDLTERIQVKLLRVLQEREIERVGETRVRKIDVRIVAATHRDLRRLVEEGRFREDLFFRLNVIPMRVPPLRDRREDIPRLAGLFLREISSVIGKQRESLSPDAMRALLDYRWPGNIRELRNAVEHGVVKSRGPSVMLEDLPREIIEETATVAATARAPAAAAGESPEAAIIRDALERSAWHRGRAAKLLGVDRATLWRRMRRLGMLEALERHGT